ncbi:Glu-tRNA(Gln) amidotransferase GatDE subunit E [Candidatus Woesearchaeota archaeon]|nr:MAG: Glu-tRNA(Gln) amidotransferase GatDE subunit E [Candidatus Woesearchaeota archaeon]
MSKKQEIDYEKIGLICGLEIHQQLDTNKLFCNCPSIIRDDKPDVEVRRRLKAVIGEDGHIDKAALAAANRDKFYDYQGYTDSTCLIEFDEQPPETMNKNALEVVLQVSKMINAEIVDEIQVMRKTVVDGSNTSGFQRTSLVGQYGYLTVNNKRIGVPTICIEEDSAKIVSRNKNYDVYNLSRLGIPLIELATDPDINHPEEAKEVASMIGMILRSTGKVKRGLGTIRQDVNVSIKGGLRVEIKGAQDLKMIPTLIDNEIIRQKYCINFKTPKTSDLIDVSKTLEKCESKVIRSALDNKGVVLAIKIEGFNGKLGEHISPGKRLGSELSDYAKGHAGVKGLFHSDELPKYGITEKEVESIKKKLVCKKDDAFIIIGDNEEVSKRALKSVKDRFKNILTKEVRKANEDGTTSYMRPMPGAARMYPETDCVPIKPNVKDIKLPELISDKILRFEKDYKISKDLASQLAKQSIDFDDYTKRFKDLTPSYIADNLINTPKLLKTRYKLNLDIFSHIDELFLKVEEGVIPKDSITDILLDIGSGKKIDFNNYAMMSDDDISKVIKEVIASNKGAPMGALMGEAMKRLKGKAEGKKISEILRKLM